MIEPDEIEEVELLDTEDNEDLLAPLEEFPSDRTTQEFSGRYFSADANPYVNSFFPVIFIDRKMKILFANKACHNLFTGFFQISGNYFNDVFGKSFGIDGIREIHNTISEGQNDFFWKGEVKIKTRDMVSVQIKVYIFPANLDMQKPDEFVVMFDDITEENKKLTRSTFSSLLEA